MANVAAPDLLEADGCGHWRIDAEPAPHLGVDLASSAMTNALPVHRMAPGLVSKRPLRLPTHVLSALPSTGSSRSTCASRMRTISNANDYTAPVFDFAYQLVYDDTGLVPDYPGIGVRAG